MLQLNHSQKSIKCNLFNEISTHEKIQESPLLAMNFCHKETDTQVLLQIFNDRLVKINESKASYLLFNDEIVFSYHIQLGELQFKYRETSQKKTFKSINNTELIKFVQQLKKRCCQQNFVQKFQILQEKANKISSWVYKVKRKSDGNIFAAKKIIKYGLNFKKQIEILKQLQHPNLIYFREYFIETDKTAYVIMDYEDGGSLLNILRSGIQMSPKQKFKIITHMLNGLQFLRLKDIVHRDLKPQNILYSSKDKNYKIADFGLSRRVGDKIDKVSGTPGYIAPEIFKSNSQNVTASIKSDIYSMGLIFYQLITSKAYYHGQNPQQVLKNNMQIKSLKKKNSSDCKIDKTDFKILQSMIRTDPNLRKNSCQILQSSIFSKINKIYSLDFQSSTSPTSLSHKKLSDSNNSQTQENQNNLVSSIIKLLRIRSWST